MNDDNVKISITISKSMIGVISSVALLVLMSMLPGGLFLVILAVAIVVFIDCHKKNKNIKNSSMNNND